MFLMNLTWSKTVLDFKVSKSESLVNYVLVSDWLFHPMPVAAESAVVLGGCAVMSSDVKQMLPYADYPPIDSSKTLVRISLRQRVVKQLVMRCVCPTTFPCQTFWPTLSWLWETGKELRWAREHLRGWCWTVAVPLRSNWEWETSRWTTMPCLISQCLFCPENLSLDKFGFACSCEGACCFSN